MAASTTPQLQKPNMRLLLTGLVAYYIKHAPAINQTPKCECQPSSHRPNMVAATSLELGMPLTSSFVFKSVIGSRKVDALRIDVGAWDALPIRILTWPTVSPHPFVHHGPSWPNMNQSASMVFQVYAGRQLHILQDL